MPGKPILKICSKGHKFYKSSDCPVCPICEKNKKSGDTYLEKIGAPAKRALDSKGISKLEQLTKYSAAELLEWHGVGPRAVELLRTFLKEKGLGFRK